MKSKTNKKRLKEFSKKVIPIIEKMIPLGGNPWQEARNRQRANA